MQHLFHCSLHFMKQATQGYKGGISNIPSIGCYCCAKSPDDDTWYRAKITSVQAVEFNETAGIGESILQSIYLSISRSIDRSINLPSMICLTVFRRSLFSNECRVKLQVN